MQPELPKAKCGAKTRSGKPCTSPPVKGRNRCRMHGGASLRGAESGQYKHGLHSKYMATLSDHYDELRADPDGLLDLTHGLAVLEVAVASAAERVSDGDVPELRKNALRLAKQVRGQFDDGAPACANDLVELLETGINHDRQWEHLIGTTERLQKRQEEAWKIRVSKVGSIPATAMKGILERIVRISQEEGGEDVGRRILARIDREIMGGVICVQLPGG